MNILCFIDNLGSGGAQRQLVNLSIMFKNKGHNVKFLVYGQHDFFEKKLIDNNIEIIKVEAKNYLSRMLKIRKIIRKGWQDIVISFLETPNFIACFSAIGKHKWKLITNERSGTESSFQGIKNKIFKKMEKYSNYTVCNSYVARDIWIKYIPNVKNKIDVIYNYIDIDANFNYSTYIPFVNGKKNIVIVASYQYIKNIIGVVKALTKIDEEEKCGLHIDWFGHVCVTNDNTKAYDEAINLINENNLNEIINLHGENNNIYPIMNNADFVGLFSKYEGLPNVICEAMMLGKPVIMTPVSDYNKLINGNGILCKSPSVSDICIALKECLKVSEEELILMGNNSKTMAKNLFDYDIIYKKWNNLFQKLINGAGNENINGN